MMKPESSSGQSTEMGYRVQVRDPHFSTLIPVALWDGLVGPDWRDVQFVKGDNPAGIPEELFGHKSQHNLLTYEGAVALAWTIIAQNRLRSLECRIVQYKLETSFILQESGIVEGLIKQTLYRDIKLHPESGPTSEGRTEL